MVVLDEQSFLLPETAGLRCLDSRLPAQHSLVERSPAVAANESKARCFVPKWAYADSRAGPACQGASSLCRYSRHLPPAGGSLSYQGSWREAPERFIPNALHSERFNGSSERSIGYNGRREQQLPATRRGRKVTEGCIERLSRSRSQYGRDGGQDAVPGHCGAGDEP